MDMASTTIDALTGLFSDEVFTSTDLNRRSAEVLNRARQGPVTIARTNELFALLRREDAAQLVRAASELGKAIRVFNALAKAQSGSVVPEPFGWIGDLCEADRNSFLLELTDTLSRANNGDCSWEEVDAVIHEWHSSAMVIRSGILKNAIVRTEEFGELEPPQVEEQNDPPSHAKPDGPR